MNNKKFLCLFMAMAVILSLIGCNKSPSPETYKGTGEIVSIKEYINGIPVLEYYRDDGAKKPVVFSLHGYGGSKEAHIEHCKILAEKGYYAVTMDAYGHGERSGEQLLNFAQVVSLYPHDIASVVDSLKDESQADVYNMGMCGISMGAMAIFMYATYGEIKPKAIAPIIGTPDLNQLKDSTLSKTAYDAKTGQQTSTMPQEEINAILENASPYKDYINLKDTAIFMQNGGIDYLIRSDGCQKLYDALKQAGAQNIELVIYPEMQHLATTECFNAANDFLDRFLLP